jgi:glycosyltransferase involved in cell wall biosynthesis
MPPKSLEVTSAVLVSIIAFPYRGSSYTECFYPAIEGLGAQVRAGVPAGRWLLKNLRNAHYIHIHWPSFLYGYPGRWRSIYGFATFVFMLLLARLRGIGLIWTIHNLYPHDRCIVPHLDIWARYLLVRLGTMFVVHGHAAAMAVAREFPSTCGRVVVIQHGHWIGYYADGIDRCAARTRLAIGNHERVFLFFGLCKPYKNLEALVETFAHFGEDATLVIAGAFQDPVYETRIRALVMQSGARILLHSSGYVPADEVQIYFKACDVVVAPYLDVLTSGTAMLALSFGRPFIGPASGFIREVIVNECGCLYDPAKPATLQEAMRKAMDMNWDESEIILHAKKHDWTQSARLFLTSLKTSRGKF